MYSTKAIPTTYAGVNFRSRLEARWASFFDLVGWRWEYEPFDFEGWAPDFLLRTKLCNVLCEVKPVDLISIMDDATDQYNRGEAPEVYASEYQKTRRYKRQHQILLLGHAPLMERTFYPIGIPLEPPRHAAYSCDDIIDELCAENSDHLWREAGNMVQWQPDNDNESVIAIVDRAVRKSAQRH